MRRSGWWRGLLWEREGGHRDRTRPCAGKFFNGDSFIVLHTRSAGDEEDAAKLAWDIYFWLGSESTQDEVA